jgi:hypothetical protein
MRTLLVVSVASIAFATGAFAQSSYVDRASGATVPVDVYGQSRQAPTTISNSCGVEYSMQDPDPNIRLELLRDCTSNGPEGGAGD